MVTVLPPRFVRTLRRAALTTAAPMALLAAALPAAVNAQAVALPPPPPQQVPAGIVNSIVAGDISNIAASADSLTTTVTQTSARAVIDWQQLSVTAGTTLAFVQPDANSITLNRVLAGGPATVIDGTVTGNGKIWILNPSGLFIGQGGSITTSGFLASTGSINVTDFMDGASRISITDATDAAISNLGQITINSGHAVLAGTRVDNGGFVSANLGVVAMGSGTAFTLDFTGDQLIAFAIAQGLPSGSASGGLYNGGTLSAAGGTLFMTARAATDAIGAVINTNGTVMAQSVSLKEGHIVLDAGPGGSITASGTIDAAGFPGGSINITGNMQLNGPLTIATNGDLQIDGTISSQTDGMLSPQTETFASVLFDGVPLSNQNIAIGANAWNVYSFDVTATNSSSTISFDAYQRPAWNGLDSVYFGVGSALTGTNLLVNGGFESGDLSGWTNQHPNDAYTWSAVATGTYDLSAFEGSFFASTGCVDGACTLSQSVATTPGTSYSLSFAFNPGATFSGPRSLDVSAGNLTIAGINMPSDQINVSIAGSGTITGPVAANILRKTGLGSLRLGGFSNAIAELAC